MYSKRLASLVVLIIMGSGYSVHRPNQTGNNWTRNNGRRVNPKGRLQRQFRPGTSVSTQKFKAKMSVRSPPDGFLEMEWAFGYNGHTARNNLKVNKSEQLVYYVAGVCIVHDIVNKTQKFLTDHTEDITCLAMTSDRSLVATGQIGKDAMVIIWDAITCAPVSVLRNAHVSGVYGLSFSTDGQLLASVGGPEDRQDLAVWDWKKSRQVAFNAAYAGKVEEVEWQPESVENLVTCGSRHIRFWKLSGNVLQARQGVFGKWPMDNQVALTHLPNGRVITGTSGGNINVWNDAKLTKVIEDVHPGGVLASDIYDKGVVTAGKDGKINLFDFNLDKIASITVTESQVYGQVGSIRSIILIGDQILYGTEWDEIWSLAFTEKELESLDLVKGHSIGELWGLATHPSKLLAVTASDDKTVRIWDIENRIALATTVLTWPARSAGFSPDGEHIAVGFKEGCFVILNAETLIQEHLIDDRHEMRNDVKYSPDGKYLAVASNDNFVDIYAVDDNYNLLKSFSGASSFISHLDWSKNAEYIQTNSGAGERLIYDFESGKIIDESSIPNVEWATWTGVLGNQVLGLWQKYSDLSDVNAVDANFELKIVASGDDSGSVKLFRFPCSKRGAASLNYVGHSEHVTNVRWSFDNQYLLSTGGADHAVFVWRYNTSETTAALTQEKVSNRPDEVAEVPVDTDDEYEGLPEVSVELDEDIATTIHGSGSSITNGVAKGTPRSIVKYLPDVVSADSSFVKRKDATGNEDRDIMPTYTLEMKHVFGYRAHECRNNAHWLRDGRITYHIAGVGVVYDKADNSQTFYLGHGDDILCLAVHPDREIVATGQQGKEADIHVWNSTDTQIISILKKGHERGVSSVTFSADGEVVASVGLDDYQTINIWNWKKGFIIASARGNSQKVFGVAFSPVDKSRLISFGVKHVRFWTQTGGGLAWKAAQVGDRFKQTTALCCGVGVDEGGVEWWAVGVASGHVMVIQNMQIVRTVKVHRSPVFDISVNKTCIWTAGQDGYVCSWDVAMKKCLKVFPVTNHFLTKDTTVGLTTPQPGVRSLSTPKDESEPVLIGTINAELLVMTGAGEISIWIQGHSKGELWGLDAHPSLPEAATVSDERTLRRWHLQERRCLGFTDLRKPARCLAFHPNGSVVAVGFMDGSVTVHAYPSLEKLTGVQRRQEGISDVRFSPDGRLLAVGSHEMVVDLYVVELVPEATSKSKDDRAVLKQVGVCRGASAWITHITWLQDSRLLQINSGAGEELFYEAPKGHRQLIPDSLGSQLAWAPPLTCPLDETLSGVWAPMMLLTDINAVATSSKLPLVVTASDNEGLVRIFAYPCMGSLKKSIHVAGHSSHVTNVKWSFDDAFVVTTGGGDTSVIVWEVQKLAPESAVPLVTEPANLEETLKKMNALTNSRPKVPVPSTRKTADASISSTKVMEYSVETLPSQVIVLPDDETLFIVSATSVSRVKITKGAESYSPNFYSGHETPVTSVTLFSTEPMMIASAQLGRPAQDTMEAMPALVHVWNPADASTATVLKGGAEKIVRFLEFSPRGKFLAALSDACLVAAHTDLQTETVLGIHFVSEASLVVLTPQILFFCDLVGNTLVKTKGKAPGAMMLENYLFTGFTVMNERVIVACSDGSLVVWKDRVAVSQVAATIKAPVDTTTMLPFQVLVTNTEGSLYTVHKSDSIVVLRHFNVTDDEVTFTQNHSTKTPSIDWYPRSVSHGKVKIVIGSIMNQNSLLFNTTADAFITLDVSA